MNKEAENIRIDIAYVARYMQGISPKLEKYKELEKRLSILREKLRQVKKSQ